MPYTTLYNGYFNTGIEVTVQLFSFDPQRKR